MVRILLVDEQKVIREGLRVLLESEPDIEIVAAVDNGYAAISKIEEVNPNILFLSIKLSEIEGFDVVAIIRNKYPEVKVIIFSDGVNEQHLIQSLEMGVKGYLLKDTPLQEMVEAIHAVSKGDTHVANTAYENIIPQISQTLSELSTDESEIVFGEASEYQELPKWGILDTPTTPQNSSDTIANRAAIKPEVNSSEFKPSPHLLMPVEDELEPPLSLPPEEKEEDSVEKNGLNRYFSAISIASFGLLAISIGVMSVISQRSPQVVIENAVINGKTIPINSPIRGKLAKINYPQGASVNAESVVATIEPLLGDRYQPITTQLQEQIELKKQQETVARQSLSFLEVSLQSLEQESVNNPSGKVDTLIRSLHLNQIKYQETALKTAKLREDSAKINYENLQQMSEQNRLSEAQLNSAKNSWNLAKLAIEEITVNLESTRQEYELLKQEITGGKQQLKNQLSQKIARLKQQIENQQISVNLLQEELANLQNELVTAISQAAEIQSIPIKSPITGAVYTHQYSEGEIVESSEAIATIIDCNYLWIEATVNPEIVSKIDTQEPVTVTVADRNLSLTGKISLIESLSSHQQDSYNGSTQRAISTQIPPTVTAGNYSRVVVTVPSSVDLLSGQQYCSVGQTARLSFGEEHEESVVSRWQPQWLSKILTFQFY
ncbi:hypothetical protein H1P_190024 [Hyella patelloides LEGE 07179]|uniref:Response regulatory domain-containing protein n=1 Tax=Hyella patelloides LEGE 07179 TaxID=945734 RepID=A0A563VPF0_9CYAN|nr:response regulator [Hyella patelloides]VEP13225.1 hypothetical protein H1P_190024 [Hyella patelloides LEGE 07179]